MNEINKVIVDEHSIRALFEVEIDRMIKLTKDDLIWSVNEDILKHSTELDDEQIKILVDRKFEKKEIEFSTFHLSSTSSNYLLRIFSSEENFYDPDPFSYPQINFKLKEILEMENPNRKYSELFTKITKEEMHSEKDLFSEIFAISNSENEGFLYYAKDTNLYMMNHKNIFEIKKENIYKICEEIIREREEVFNTEINESKKELNLDFHKQDIAEYEKKKIKEVLDFNSKIEEKLTIRKRRL